MPHRRLLLGCLFLFLLIGLMLYYGLDHNNHDPDPQYILAHYQQFTATKALLDGTVKAVNPTNHTLYVQVGQTIETILLVSTTESLNTTHPGDQVEFYGNFTSKTHITAENLLITTQWMNTLIYIRSLPAIPFALYLFFRSYRFNRKTFWFERRQNHA